MSVYTTNEIRFAGTIQDSAQLRFSAQGTAVCGFRLEHTGDRGKKVWMNAVAFGDAAQAIATELKQDDFVYVAGRLQSGSYVDKDGNKRSKVEIVVREISKLSPPSFEVSEARPELAVVGADDAIPF